MSRPCPIASIAAALGCCVAVSACQGSLKTTIANDEERNGNYEGVKFYPTTLFKEYSHTTIILKEGRITASSMENPDSPAYCKPVDAVRYLVAADFSRPLVMKYTPGLLEAYTFTPALTDGMLTGFGVTSTPDAGKTFANVGSFMGGLASMGALSKHGKKPPPETSSYKLACTDGLVAFKRVPELPQYPASSARPGGAGD